MNNKIFLKIGSVLISIIFIYILFITFIISPKISSYLINLETKEAKAQLDRVSAIIDAKETNLKELKEVRTEEHKKSIRNISFIAYNIINNYYKMYENGILSKNEVLKYAFETISQIEYGHEDDYIFILDKKGTLVFHPDKKYYNENVYNRKDAIGKSFIREIIENSMVSKETYTKYSWEKLNSSFVSEKIVHSVYFEPFELIISSGVYVENIKKELVKEKKNVIKELEPLLKSIVLGEKGYIFILNGENKVLIHHDEKLIGKNVSKLKAPGTDTYMVENLKKSFQENKAWVYKWNKPDDIENYNYEKIAWVNYNKFFDWYIVSSIYKDDLEIKSNDINSMIINISLVLLIVLVFLAIFFIKKLLSPITVLSKNVDLVKNGNLTVRNKIHTNDELGYLADHFDGMLDSIEENTKNLEYKIETRTAELKYKLYYDELTGLKNRISLVGDLKKEEFCALSLIDIESFDDINELYGYSVGNEILVEIMQMLKTFCKKRKIVLYRLETGNFAIIDNRIEKFVSYDNFLEEILTLFKKEIYIKSLGIEIFVYVTIGASISQLEPLKSANIALKKAKQNGVRFLVYNKSIDTRDNIKKSMYWREKINEAIDEDRVIPFFQAIYDSNKNIIKYETLMRIHDEIDGKPYYLSPGTFFEIAIKTKQYFKLNQIVIKKALDNIDKINKDISINISFSDVMNRGFSQFIEETINNLSKEQREKVVFEILESDHISDYGILDAFIIKYRKKGIRIAIDDFGTGYSNFSHILKVKPDYIKIDGSLIKNINSDENSYEMVKAIIDFSKALNITIIAEFIHSQEVFDIVKELGADEFQGYFLGEPELLI